MKLLQALGMLMPSHRRVYDQFVRLVPEDFVVFD